MRVLINPSAGRGPRQLRRLRSARPDVEWIESESAAHFQSLVRDAEEAGGGALGLAGGDGTISLALGALAQPNRVPWRIIPSGSGNDFAHLLGVTRENLGGQLRRVDIGRVAGERGGRPFCCVASLGLDARALEIVHGSRWPRGKLLNLYAAVRGLLEWRPRRVRVSWQGGRFEGAIMFAAVTNTRSYAGGFRVAPGARLDDGKLDLCIVAATSRARLLWQFPRIFAGTHGALPEVVLAQSPWVRIESDEPLPVALDGELPSLTTPIELTCDPNALAVLA